MLNKKFNNTKPDIWFKNHNLIIEADEGNHENYDSGDEKVKPNANDHNFDLFKFLDEINLNISKLRKQNEANTVNNKIAEDFEKIAAMKKLKELKRYTKNTLPNYKKLKTQNQK